MAQAPDPVAGPSGKPSPQKPYTIPAFVFDRTLIANIPETVIYMAHHQIVTVRTIEEFGGNTRTDTERVRFIHELLIKHDLIPKGENVSIKGDKEAMNFQCQATVCLENQNPTEALYFFNKMVSLVDYKSVGSPMSFAFRSSVFANLGRWSECLEDTEVAITSDVLEETFLAKLLERQKEAKAQVEKETKRLRELVEKPFTYEPEVQDKSQRIPNVAACIRIETTKKKGRRLLAKRDINPGEIMAIARPYCHRIMPIRKYLRCHNCLSENNMRLIPCGFCTQAMFCGAECSIKAFNSYHRMECPIIDFMHRFLNLEEQLVVRMTLKAALCFPSIAELRNFLQNECLAHSDALNPIAKYYTEDQQALHQILRLRNSRSFREGTDVFRRATLAAMISEMLIRYSKMKDVLALPEDMDFFMDLFMQMVFIADLNTRNLRNMRGDIYAKGIYPMVGLFNHSCAANVDRFGYNQEMVLVTNRKISAGDELTNNFG